MFNRLTAGATLSLAVLQACACSPDLPDEDDQSDASDSETSPTDTQPTGPTDTYEPPCDVPEVEPNDAAGDATALPLDRVGCGAISEELDLDYFRFELEEDDWISVRLDAEVLASRADVALTLTSDGGQSAVVYDSPSSADVELLFPAVADGWDLLVTEQNAEGSEYHDYEVLVSVTKEPLSWRTEETSNESFSTAEELVDGDLLFGWLEDDDDADWFTIDIPAGKHTVIIDTLAWRYGSAGNFEFTIYDDDQNRLQRVTADGGRGLDPVLETTSDGDESWTFRVKDQNGQGGLAYWYVLDIQVVGEEE